MSLCLAHSWNSWLHSDDEPASCNKDYQHHSGYRIMTFLKFPLAINGSEGRQQYEIITHRAEQPNNSSNIVTRFLSCSASGVVSSFMTASVVTVTQSRTHSNDRLSRHGDSVKDTLDHCNRTSGLTWANLMKTDLNISKKYSLEHNSTILLNQSSF